MFLFYYTRCDGTECVESILNMRECFCHADIDMTGVSMLKSMHDKVLRPRGPAQWFPIPVNYNIALVFPLSAHIEYYNRP